TKCKKCGTELSDPDRLKRHIEKAHTTKIKEKCRVCGTEFYTSDELRKHKKKCK
ncbi:MAG: C2H2-type zinc finger protein, partial [Nitrosopumilaceae archaeon]